MKKSQKLSRLIIAAVAMLTFSSCGADSSTGSTSVVDSGDLGDEETSGAPAETPTIESKSIFVATLLSGESFESQKVLQNQPLALWFWAPG